MHTPPDFLRHELTDGSLIFKGRVPTQLQGNDAQFEQLWILQPPERPYIMIHGKPIQIPRNQQAFGADYSFSGQVSRALPVPDILMPYLMWAREAIDVRLNGLLLNWYNGDSADYIGPHHDKTKALVSGSPIVTISCGASRTFRLTRGKGSDRKVGDFTTAAGDAFVMPWETNQRWKHEGPHFARDTGRRISITLRAFHAPMPGEEPSTASLLNSFTARYAGAPV